MAIANPIGDVSLLGTNHSYNSFTYLADSAMTEEDAGKPAAITTDKANAIHVATAGEKIIGYIEQVEDRELEGIKVATVTMIGFFKFNLLNGDAVAVGDSIVGGGDGTVKKADDTNGSIVVEKGSDYVVARICN